MVEIAIGPPHLAINQGHTVLLSEPDGQIVSPSQRGLFFFDTRLISNWRISANGQAWNLLNGGNLDHYASRVFLINTAIPTEKGMVPPHTLQLTISRSIDGGMHEDLDVINYGRNPAEFNLEILIQSDFADLFEVKSGNIVQRGQTTTEWSAEQRLLRTVYRRGDFSRDIAIFVDASRTAPLYANGRLRLPINLAPGRAWHGCLLYEFGDGTVRTRAPAQCISRIRQSTTGQRLERWKTTVLKVETSNDQFCRLFRQAIDDVAALRLPIEGNVGLEFVPAGGVPWFVALFGRDSLVASLQNISVFPDFARATLDILGIYQADTRDDYRDAEPGKIMHELRHGELAHFNAVPHSPYYGSADATILYLILLHTAWRSTGDRGLLERHLQTAERCLDWIDRYGDRDGDGFQEYATRSSQGYENQGWKDAGDAVMYPDGSPVQGPKALCELQGYVYDAWKRMADIFDCMGKHDAARSLRIKADALFDRFNEAFWDEESQFYAYALDGNKRKVMTVASNPGQCLWSGIVPRDRAAKVVRRLMAEDMWSGWGVRTLSADHAAYNPHSYQNGSVWPHDNGLIAMGLRRYGFAEEACRIAQGVGDAGGYFAHRQMPELYAGLPRNAMDFPVQYSGANVPQAWAAGSTFMLLQAMLGLVPDAPDGRLYLDPVLPDWLANITVIDLRVGDQKFDIRFWRAGSKSCFEVLRGDPHAVSRRSFASGPELPC